TDINGGRINDGQSTGGNAGAGMRLDTGANGNIIGGKPGAGPRTPNTIVDNLKGVVITDPSSTRNSIDPDEIFDDQELGIDLGDDGVTPNDAGDGDTGPNLLQNFPMLTLVRSSGGSTRIEGTMDSSPGNSTYPITIEFFDNTVADPSGYGEGETFLGSIAV